MMILTMFVLVYYGLLTEPLPNRRLNRLRLTAQLKICCQPPMNNSNEHALLLRAADP